MQDQVPVLTPIGGPVDPPLWVLSKRVTERGDINDVRILGMNTDLPYMAGLLKTQVNPTFTAIGRLVDAVAKRDIDANRGLTSACVNHIRITVRNCERTDSGAGQVPI